MPSEASATDFTFRMSDNTQQRYINTQSTIIQIFTPQCPDYRHGARTEARSGYCNIDIRLITASSAFKQHIGHRNGFMAHFYKN